MTSQITAASPASSFHAHVGDHLREWRQRRRLSQLDLALEADVSARHLSFVETGRATPSREMLLRLAERLDVPLRERNVLLVSAGYAPVFPQRALEQPDSFARATVERVLAAHEPSPALAIDRHWNLLFANRMVAPLLEGVAPSLLTPPVNVLRLAFHPEGLASRTVNPGEWCGHLRERLQRQVEATADPVLVALQQELKTYPIPARRAPLAAEDAIAVPFRLRLGAEVFSFISTTMLFGTPLDISLSELAIETFFPADAATAARLKSLSRAL